ncbi:MAG: DNA primase [Puniceicoccales bacterium]|jgi:DNA primase|nr:DNA primase [Puniceicoccales bacterium]
MIARSCIEKIKNSVDIYDVVAPYVPLKRCGANWKGLSPFNHEKTPSFFVMPAKKIFRCFSSGHAGDIFNFVQLQENVSFADAVEMIANRFNIPLEFEQSANFEKRPYSKKTLFDLHALVCDFFVENFHAENAAGEKIRQYWTGGRKFSLDVARENGIGFGGDDDRLLIQKILGAKFSMDAIKASGIFYCKDGETNPHRCKSRFNSRLTIPIHDIQGRVVGFSARFIEGISRSDDFSDAKYINSPETDLFHKGGLLFGLDRARQYLEPNDAFWIVEGQFDAMRCWDNGINTAVAPQGTAITDAQLSALHRYTVRVNCMLDGDAAGLKAAERMLPMAMAAGLDVKFFILPQGSDPDSYFCEDFENRFKLLQQSGMTGVQFLVKRFLGKGKAAQEKAEALKRIYEVISVTESSVALENYLDEVAAEASLDRYALSQDFKSFSARQKFTAAPRAAMGMANANSPQKLSSAEGQLLPIILLDDKIAEGVAKFFDQSFLQNLHSNEGKVLLKVLNEIRNDSWEGMSAQSERELFSSEEIKLAYSLIADFDEECERIATVNVCLKKLHSNFVKGEIDGINEKLREISLDETGMIRTLQEYRLSLRKMLRHPPQIF